MSFGKKMTNLTTLRLDGKPLEWVSTWKYLGVTLSSYESFNCSVDDRLKSFYKSLNSILRIEGRSNDLVMLRLLESHSLPILTYAIEIVHVANSDSRRKMRVAYNAIFHKIFNYRYHESVTELQHFLERPTWEELVATRIEKFHENLLESTVPSILH